MRHVLVLLATTSLAACSGAGPTTVGGSAAPSQSPVAGVPTGTTDPHTFVRPTQPKTYSAIGSVQHYEYNTDVRNTQNQYAQFYSAIGSTARSSGYSIAYNPRDAVFDVTLLETSAKVNQTLRFQDPLHRTDFGGQREPQGGVPNFESQGFLYLQAGGNSAAPQPLFDPAQSDVFPVGIREASRDVVTFFFQRPGTVTQHVTLAGYVRNATNIPKLDDIPYILQQHTLERGVFAYGERTTNDAVPITGTASFTGPMISSLVYNPLRDTDNSAPTYFQWMTGNATTTVNFAANTFTFDVTGTVGAPLFDIFTSRVFTLRDGATFAASGAGLVDLIRSGGFVGQFSTASFTQPVSAGGTVIPMTIAGSSIDGTFYGPAAQEVGGGFRIVGGNPDERIDVIGAFTGRRP